MAGRLGWILSALLVLAAPAGAATLVPFTETFDASAAGWVDAVSGPLVHNASGGLDGSGYVSTTAGSINDPGTIQFRGNAANGASGGAFTGDWADVSVLSASVIHDAPAPLSFFFRVTTGANFPAHVGVVPVPVQPGTWTEISVAIDPANPLLIAEAGTFEQTFGAVTNVQIGVSVPLELEGVPFTYGLDDVAIVPEPSVALLVAGGLLGLGGLRRRLA